MIGVIGNGSWATALAKLLTENQHTISWWMRSEAAVQHLIEKGHNEQYLSSVVFDRSLIHPTTDLDFMIQECDILVMCIPSAYMLDILQQIPKDGFKNKKIISAIKGVLPEQHQLLQEYLIDHFDMDINQYFAITGPCHAEEVAQERLSYLTFSGTIAAESLQIASLFETPYLRTTTNNDLWGSQYAAVLKNIYAVGSGIAHGLGYGDNFLSVYITNCYREMYRFLSLHFQQKSLEEPTPDFHTSAYLGDLLVTCYSPHSRNRTFGALLGKGYSVSAAKAEMNMVAEGYYASVGMKTVIDAIGIDMPIMKHIYGMLWEQKSCNTTFKQIEHLLC
ncbi:glycerol-3-phosphate dehydrogenase [Taibaiella sp. KBW10]|uniref:NAD(P)H-dependent glycerol-3-phosphate dehydrogenase n=1 Tax=Taibaiella sp. KBW10 TaxID=2153357 RepID=UPI000F5B2C17|nr:NAD(P)H-dependent glycerol-3-phosphate dehydrogenase [Taibaiella sp. KBW10]RQO31159.1 glycerol-3-phosphate dehydrogenase [Taibaiella sp. KBW10]